MGEKALQIDQTAFIPLCRVLESGNIHPSNTTTYTVKLVFMIFILTLICLAQVSKIMDTIHSATGHVPLLYCYNKQTNVQILQQIVLCMNKQFDLIDCPEEPHAYCYKDEPVLYPQRPSTSWWCCRVVQWLQHRVFVLYCICKYLLYLILINCIYNAYHFQSNKTS